MIVGVRHFSGLTNVFKVTDAGKDIVAEIAHVRREVPSARTVLALVPKAVWDLRLEPEAA